LQAGRSAERVTRCRFRPERSIGVWLIEERRLGDDWVVGGNRSKGSALREVFALRRVRGIVGLAGSPRPPAPARRARRRRDWPRDRASQETAQRAVRSCGLFATAR